jgi:diadenosine tetraphosphate (Ap4A) HIT family hydrolase
MPKKLLAIILIMSILMHANIGSYHNFYSSRKDMKYSSLFALSCLLFINGSALFAAQAAKPICYPCIPFVATPNAIAKSRLFYASIDPRDARVPRVFVQTHEHISTLADWSQDHWLEFGKFEKAMEKALRVTFNTDLVNVACLMNLAGEEGTHTHWHFIPRLPNTILLADEKSGEIHTYEDPCYGKPYDMNGKNYRAATPTMKLATIKAIQKNLDLSNVPQ